jgi:dynein heavy chain
LEGILIINCSSGKQSLARLASFTAGCVVFEIQLSRGYGEYEFREDLKNLFKLVGLENKKVVFLFTDAHIVEEGFLELVNTLLTSGAIPSLYAEDERDLIINSVRDEAEKLNISGKENLWQYFIKRCNLNLHVVLAMSPTGDKLRTRCRNFPGMVNNTLIDWFMPWPEQGILDLKLNLSITICSRCFC